MKVIDDKDVGKIWRERRNFYHPESKWFETDNSVMLIRKLVAERAMRQMLGWKGTDWTEGFDAATSIALGDFGIDPADWKAND